MKTERWMLALVLASLIVALLLVGPSPEAATCDLTTAGSSCSFTTGIDLYMQADPQPTGTGVIDSFVRIQSNGTEQGYNTDARPVAFDEKTDPNFTRSLLLTQIPEVTINGVTYREFGLDINENNSPSGHLLSLDQLKIFMSPSDAQNTTNVNALGTLVYNLDATGGNWIKLDYSLGSGSGSGDMFAYINTNLFSANLYGPYVTLYSQFGTHYRSDAGFEEWWVRQGQGGASAVPEPTSVLLLCSGLGVIGLWRVRTRDSRR
jgi:hypothetical protein